MFPRATFIILLLLWGGGLLWGDVKSTTGKLRFDSDRDGTPEATLSTNGMGLGLGLGTTASTNLEVQGNALVRVKAWGSGSLRRPAPTFRSVAPSPSPAKASTLRTPWATTLWSWPTPARATSP